MKKILIITAFDFFTLKGKAQGSYMINVSQKNQYKFYALFGHFVDLQIVSSARNQNVESYLISLKNYLQ